MKTNLLLLASLIVAGSVSLTSAVAETSASVQFHEPEKFTDFRLSQFGTDKETQVLEKQFRNEIERLAAANLPPGYHLRVVFTNIEMAGDFEPQLGPDYSDVRIVRDIYYPRLELAYEVVDPNGNVVQRGEETLKDMNFLDRVRIRTDEPLIHEFALLDDFVRKVGRSLS